MNTPDPKTHHKTNKRHKVKHAAKQITHFIIGILIGSALLVTTATLAYTHQFKDTVIKGVWVGKTNISGYSPSELERYFVQKSEPLKNAHLTLHFESTIATMSGEELGLKYDEKYITQQAFSVGRGSNFLSNLYQIYFSQRYGTVLTPIMYIDNYKVETKLNQLSQLITIEPENGLFEFSNNKVTAFKPSKSGRYLDIEETKKLISTEINKIPDSFSLNAPRSVALVVKEKKPEINTAEINNFGIKELIASGESYYRGSIPGRIYNVKLAATRVSGTLIPPNTTFSFNKTVGEISAATGYKQAYVIKSGRTVLDDGGGVCQVSTTLFRAALNAGLPITERHAHAYRVGYYEQGGWKPGFDATVYYPTYDLQFQNDTDHHLLIQAIVDPNDLKLTFEIYGTRDNRTVEISEARLWDKRPAPPDVYQDDPSLPAGTIKQVDWSNPGIKAAFDYTVTKNGIPGEKKTFFSNFVPWRAVFLKGTGA